MGPPGAVIPLDDGSARRWSACLPGSCILCMIRASDARSIRRFSVAVDNVGRVLELSTISYLRPRALDDRATGAAGSTQYPWCWTPAHVDEFLGDLRSERRAKQSTIHNCQDAPRAFCSYVSTSGHGWDRFCERFFGTHPTQVCFGARPCYGRHRVCSNESADAWIRSIYGRDFAGDASSRSESIRSSAAAVFACVFVVPRPVAVWFR